MLLHALIVDCVHLSTSMEKNKSENYSRSLEAPVGTLSGTPVKV